jgi:hypothetical protein
LTSSTGAAEDSARSGTAETRVERRILSERLLIGTMVVWMKTVQDVEVNLLESELTTIYTSIPRYNDVDRNSMKGPRRSYRYRALTVSDSRVSRNGMYAAHTLPKNRRMLQIYGQGCAEIAVLECGAARSWNRTISSNNGRPCHGIDLSHQKTKYSRS